MKILVGVKMVPKATDVRFVAGINRIDREDAACEMNGLDRQALAHALRLAGAHDASVCAFTMGPPQASAVLGEALAAGADRAVHLVDMRFAGADTLATARALAQLVAREQPDLVVLGRLATDGGTAQVAPQLATFAGLPVVADATSLSLRDGRLAATVRDRDAERPVEVALPAVVTVGPGVDGVDLASPEGAETVAATAAIEVLDADALGGDDAGYGIRGSATYVARIDPMPPREPAPPLSDAGAAAATLRSLAATPPPAPGSAVPSSPPGGGRALFAVADAGPRGLHRLAGEAVACARQVAGTLGAPVVAVVLGHPGEEDVEALAASGADRVLVVRSGLLDAATWGASGPLERAGAAAAELSELVRAHEPLAVIGPWTPTGRVYVPQAAARCSAGCTGDVVGLDTSLRPGTDDVIDVVWLKPAWSGGAMARVVARTPVAMGTLRPCAVAPSPVRSARSAPVEAIDGTARVTWAPATAGDGAGEGTLRPASLEDASVVVCVGTRFAGSIERVVSLAGRLGWAVGATPGAVARGILPPRDVLDTERFALSPWLAVGAGLADPVELRPLAGAARIVTVDPDKDSLLHAHADVPVACTPDQVFGAFEAALAGDAAEQGG